MNKSNEVPQAMVELPRYKSHKVVHALKIHDIDLDPESGAAVITPEDQGYGPFPVDAEYMGKHKPRIGGYYVVYEDGYKSWSPSDAFEKGYIKVAGKEDIDNWNAAIGLHGTSETVTPCGGCGATREVDRCIGCLHDFAAHTTPGAHDPLAELKAAIQADEDLAWTWQCNLACIGMYCGGDNETANRYAAQFMKNVFDVDVTTQEHWKSFESQWANKASLAWTDTCDRLLTILQTVIDSSRKRTNEEMKAVADRLTVMGVSVACMELRARTVGE